MIRCVLIFSILIFFYSCKESAPSGIINPQKMQEILWNVFKADALAQELAKHDSSRTLASENVRLTNEVFALHQITKEQFEKSYSYYAQHPDVLRTMLDSINVQQARVDSVDILDKQKQFLKDNAGKKDGSRNNQ